MEALRASSALRADELMGFVSACSRFAAALWAEWVFEFGFGDRMLRGSNTNVFEPLWRAMRDSNARPSESESDTLSN